WHTMKMDGELCDGAKGSMAYKYTTTSGEGANIGEANHNCTWLSINKDLDADEFTLITDIYDEDNTMISLTTASYEHYTI
ncbi:hypothetical protein KY312_04530, partial [Candidatus Woesearchaeota archaeon]|nr:hypothetical protein [Candidatus Woesearchaeota archaeon]